MRFRRLKVYATRMVWIDVDERGGPGTVSDVVVSVVQGHLRQDLGHVGRSRDGGRTVSGYMVDAT